MPVNRIAHLFKPKIIYPEVSFRDYRRISVFDINPTDETGIYNPELHEDIVEELYKGKTVIIDCGLWKGERPNSRFLNSGDNSINRDLISQYKTKNPKSWFLATEFLFGRVKNDIQKLAIDEIKFDVQYGGSYLPVKKFILNKMGFEKDHIFVILDFKDPSCLSAKSLYALENEREEPPENTGSTLVVEGTRSSMGVFNSDKNTFVEMEAKENYTIQDLKEISILLTSGYGIKLISSEHDMQYDTGIELIAKEGNKVLKVNLNSPIMSPMHELYLPIIVPMIYEGIVVEINTKDPVFGEETLEIELERDRYNREISIYIEDYTDSNFQGALYESLKMFLKDGKQVAIEFDSESQPENEAEFKAILESTIPEDLIRKAKIQRSSIFDENRPCYLIIP